MIQQISGYKNDAALCLEISGHIKWFGSGFHGLGTFNDTTWTYYTPLNSGLQDSRVFSIFVESSDILWVGTTFKGLFKFNLPLNSWTNYNTTNSPIPDNQINRIFKNTNDGNLFLGFGSEGVAKLSEDNIWTLYGPPISGGTGIGQFKRDKYNNIWIATTNGLFVYNEDGVVGVHDQSNIVNDFELFQNYPNPFNPTTTINYELRITNYVTLKVYDLNGKEVRTLVNEIQNSGSHEIEFSTNELASGVYFYTLSVGSFTETRRMVLIK